MADTGEMEVQWLKRAAVGGSASFYLTGDEDGSGKTLGVYASTAEAGANDPDITGITAEYVGGDDYRINVTVPASVTEPLEAGDTLFVTVWDEADEAREPLGLCAIPLIRTPGSELA